MRVALLTREYPPEVYGGAGVHVDFLARSLASRVDLDVHCQGAPRHGATAHPLTEPRLGSANPALHVLAADLGMTAAAAGADVLHSHTWYANLAGHLGKLLYGVPHVVTAHSLEPLRPWKAEQLGGGYAISSWAERTAYESADAIIAVSAGMRADVLASYPAVDPGRVHVVHNGIDTELYRPVTSTAALHAHGIDPDRLYAIFVGRKKKKKGVPHLIAAAHSLDERIQLVLLAGAPDTPELGAEVRLAIGALQAARDGVIWVEDMRPRAEVIELLTHAAVLVCPSVYEPQGIVNLEAMACETPVVASAVGGIPEVVVDGETGLLVPYDPTAPRDFEQALADAINAVAANPQRGVAMGRAGRAVAVRDFGWDAIADRTVEIYRAVMRV